MGAYSPRLIAAECRRLNSKAWREIAIMIMAIMLNLKHGSYTVCLVTLSVSANIYVCFIHVVCTRGSAIWVAKIYKTYYLQKRTHFQRQIPSLPPVESNNRTHQGQVGPRRPPTITVLVGLYYYYNYYYNYNYNYSYNCHYNYHSWPRRPPTRARAHGRRPPRSPQYVILNI